MHPHHYVSEILPAATTSTIDNAPQSCRAASAPAQLRKRRRRVALGKTQNPPCPLQRQCQVRYTRHARYPHLRGHWRTKQAIQPYNPVASIGQASAVHVRAVAVRQRVLTGACIRQRHMPDCQKASSATYHAPTPTACSWHADRTSKTCNSARMALEPQANPQCRPARQRPSSVPTLPTSGR